MNFDSSRLVRISKRGVWAWSQWKRAALTWNFSMVTTLSLSLFGAGGVAARASRGGGQRKIAIVASVAARRRERRRRCGPRSCMSRGMLRAGAADYKPLFSTRAMKARIRASLGGGIFTGCFAVSSSTPSHRGVCHRALLFHSACRRLAHRREKRRRAP